MYPGVERDVAARPAAIPDVDHDRALEAGRARPERGERRLGRLPGRLGRGGRRRAPPEREDCRRDRGGRQSAAPDDQRLAHGSREARPRPRPRPKAGARTRRAPGMLPRGAPGEASGSLMASMRLPVSAPPAAERTRGRDPFDDGLRFVALPSLRVVEGQDRIRKRNHAQEGRRGGARAGLGARLRRVKDHPARWGGRADDGLSGLSQCLEAPRSRVCAGRPPAGAGDGGPRWPAH